MCRKVSNEQLFELFGTNEPDFPHVKLICGHVVQLVNIQKAAFRIINRTLASGNH